MCMSHGVQVEGRGGLQPSPPTYVNPKLTPGALGLMASPLYHGVMSPSSVCWLLRQRPTL